jgi:phosphogluconate dehydratase
MPAPEAQALLPRTFIMALHPVLDQVTRRIQERSRASRSDYLAQVDAMAARPPQVRTMGCANVAHAFAALPGRTRFASLRKRPQYRHRHGL